MSGVALASFRPALRGSWRPMTVLALLTGILGAVTLGALAGARRTDTACDPVPRRHQRQRRVRERAELPATVAARTRPGAELRTE